MKTATPIHTILLWTALPAAALTALALFLPSPSPTTPAAAPAPTAAPVAAAAPAAASMEGIHLTAAVDREVVWQGDGTVRVSLGLRSDHDPSALARVPTDLVVVLDRSGSMSGDKLSQAKAAARTLLSQLGPEDRFALVTYDNDAAVTLPLQGVSEGTSWLWEARIAAIIAGGSTDMQAGLDLGLAQMEGQQGRAKRMILLSDGQPDSESGLPQRAIRAAAEEVPLTTVGIGEGYNEQLMSMLADVGTGNFYGLGPQDELAPIFADELDTSRETVAAALEVQLLSSAGHARIAEAGGYRVEDGEAAKIGTLYAGQDRRLWLTLHLDPQAALTDKSIDPGALRVRWRTPAGTLQEQEVDLPALRWGQSEADLVAGLDVPRWEQAVVEEVYNRMRADTSAHVQAGDRAAALARIDAYAAEQGRLNSAVQSDRIADNLVEVERLRAEVEANFEGEDQRSRQNAWSKSTNMSAYSGRKVGQAKGY